MKKSALDNYHLKLEEDDDAKKIKYTTEKSRQFKATRVDFGGLVSEMVRRITARKSNGTTKGGDEK